ncbi:MAG TPA: cytochrome C assembly protein, partial [Planctomycetaceae bacterium]|nr:cytochrome C assembly protein [Planctomycetaceae bacterium]
MEFLRGVTIVCFAASYAVALGLELLRGVRRIPLRHVLIIGWTAAGLLAHTLFLYQLAYSESSGGTSRYIFSSWYDWSLLAAWGVAAAYLGLVIRRPQNAVGLFLLPLVLALIGAAVFVADRRPFEPVEAQRLWRTIHAASLLFGTVSVTLGFAAGLMYLYQSYRLKRKHPIPSWFRLPSLEWLQRF